MQPRLILAADGSERSLTVLHQVLVHLGHTVVLAASGTEAVAQAARHRPDVILLDLHLDGGDPRTTLRALATEGWAATTPVIALAGAGGAPVPPAHFAAIVRKPIVLGALAAALERCLRPRAPLVEKVSNAEPRGGQWIVGDDGRRPATPCA